MTTGYQLWIDKTQMKVGDKVLLVGGIEVTLTSWDRTHVWFKELKSTLKPEQFGGRIIEVNL